MAGNSSPFDIFKKFPHLDENFFREVAGGEWTDPTGILDRFVQDKWPLLNVMETAGEIIVMVEIPGLRSAGDVRVELKGNTLKIEGETFPEASIPKDVKVHQQETRRGAFSRSVTLPTAVNGKSARSVYRQGMLEIILAKVDDKEAEILDVDFGK